MNKRRKKYGLGGSAGALAGQALIPIPGVGAAIGTIAGDLGENLVKDLMGRKRRRRQEAAAEESKRFENRSVVDTGVQQFADGGPIDPYLRRAGRIAKKGVRFAGPLLRSLERGVQNTVAAASAGRGTPQVDLGTPKHRTDRDIKARKNRQLVRGGSGSRSFLNQTPKFAYGGTIKPMGNGGAVKITGRKHEKGGVHLTPQVEVEGGETIAKVNGNPFVFSDRVRVPGGKETFADIHEAAERRGVGQHFVEDLAEAQETVKVQKGVGQSYREGQKFAKGGFLGSGMGAKDFAIENSNLINPLVNIGAGLLGVNKPGKLKTKPVGRGAVNELRKLPTKFNIEPQLAEARASLNTVGSNSQAGTNTLLAAHSANLQNTGRLIGEKTNRENQLVSNRTSAIANATQRADEVDNRNANRAELFNTQEKSRARSANANLIMGGLGQVGKAAQQAKVDRMLTEAQPFELAAILAGADAETRGELLKRLSQGAPERFKAVLDAMNGGTVQGAFGTSNSIPSGKIVTNDSNIG